jgi:hypothetical protein
MGNEQPSPQNNGIYLIPLKGAVHRLNGSGFKMLLIKFISLKKWQEDDISCGQSADLIFHST